MRSVFYEGAHVLDNRVDKSLWLGRGFAEEGFYSLNRVLLAGPIHRFHQAICVEEQVFSRREFECFFLELNVFVHPERDFDIPLNPTSGAFALSLEEGR